LIVECTNCSTRFQLDDERIPITGIRVRCSRCKEAFFLKHPEASQHEAVDAIASEAARQQAPSVPEPASDLAGSSLDDLEKFDASGLDEDEDDWEFNHDVPAEDAPPDASSGERPGFDASSPSGLELDGDHGVVAASGAGAADPSDTFGSVEDFGNLAEDEPPAAVEESAAAEEPAPPPSGLEADIADVIESLGTLNVDDAPAAEDGSVGGDLGEPEEWDLLGGDAPEVAAKVEPSATTHMRSPVGEAVPRAASAPAQRAVRTRRAPPSAPRALRWIGSAVGWLAFSGLFAGALAQGLATSWVAVPGVTSYEVGSLVAEGVETAWATVGGGETLLVVRGELHNPSGASRSVGVSVAVDLLDAEGRPLDHPAAMAGRPLPADELRTLAPGARNARLAAAARALSRERVGADGAVEFAAYFAGIPEAARRVAVRAGESAPGSFEAPWKEPLDAAAPTAETAASAAAGAEPTRPASRP
jgi:predicted Zn finger-like uncharacterized protein